MSSIVLRWDRSRGSTYGLASLEGEGLPVPSTLQTQSYRMTHLGPTRVVPPLPQRLASGDLPVGEQHPSGEALVLEGLAVGPLVPHVPVLPEGLELLEEVASFSKYFPFWILHLCS